MKHLKWTWVWLALVMFQSSDIAIRLLAADTHFVAGAVLQAVPLLIATLIFLLMNAKKQPLQTSRPVLIKICGYGLCMFFIGNMLYYLAMQTGGLTIASPCVQSQSVWAVLLGFFLLREKVSPVMWCGILLFAAGIGGLAYFKSYATNLSGNWILAVVLALLAGLSWGGSATVNKSLAGGGVSTAQLLCGGSFVGILALLLCGGLVFGDVFWNAFLLASTYKTLLVGVFNGTAMLCVVNAIRKLPISKVIPCLSINIIISSLLGGIFFGEYISFGSILSILAAFAGVVLVQEPFKRAASAR